MTIQADIQFYENFGEPYLRFGNDFILSRDHCLPFLEYCKQMNVAVLGIEGFNLQEKGKRIPNLDEIADFSSLAHDDSWDDYSLATQTAANNFILAMMDAGKSNGYMFILANNPTI